MGKPGPRKKDGKNGSKEGVPDANMCKYVSTGYILTYYPHVAINDECINVPRKKREKKHYSEKLSKSSCLR